MFKKLSKKGFTLVELLIVIVIIGILAVAAVPKFMKGPPLSRDAVRKSDLNGASSQVDVYFASTNPSALPDITATCVSGLTTLTTNGYLAVLPKDPKTSNPAATPCVTLGDYGYKVLDSANGQYYLSASLEAGAYTDSGVTCAAALSGKTTTKDVVDAVISDSGCSSATDFLYVVAH